MDDMTYNNNDYKLQPASSFYTPSMNSPFYNKNNLVRNNYMVNNENVPSSGMKYIVSSSDGEGSPKSLDDIEATPVHCVRGVRTITRNPGRITRQNAGITKCRGRGRRPEYTVPKEKDRARLFNEAFDCLRKRIPSIPASKKLSKIEILRLAICYMSYLKFLLETDTPRNYDVSTPCSSNPCTASTVENQLQVSCSTSVTGQEDVLVDPPEVSMTNLARI